MKKLILSALSVVILIGCRKELKTPSDVYQPPEKTLQDFPKCGNDLNPAFAAKMMKARRARDQQEIVSERKPKDNPDPVSTPTVIFLDADGHIVENTIWNWDGILHCRSAGLTTDQMSLIIKSVVEDFSTFQVVVTADEDLYNSAPKARRIRVIMTTHEGIENFFPNFGGYAFIGSLWWGDDTPCFVFTELYAGRAENMAETVSHEVGHTIGLSHQSEFSFDGQFLYEYHRGFFSQMGNFSWKPIMGSSFGASISGWMYGRKFQGFQNDTELLSAVGAKSDEMSNQFSTAEEIKVNGSGKLIVTGLMNSRWDSDYYLIKRGKVTLSIVGGGNCDLTIFFYDENEQLIGQYTDFNGLGIPETTIKTDGNGIYIKLFQTGLFLGDLFSEIQPAGQYTLVLDKL